jgi:hypothetical protein
MLLNKPVILRFVAWNEALIIPGIVPRVAKGRIICPADCTTKTGFLGKLATTLALKILSQGKIFSPIEWHLSVHAMSSEAKWRETTVSGC